MVALSRRHVLVAVAAVALLARAHGARADDARVDDVRLPDLLGRLATYSAGFDHMKKNAAATFAVQWDELDRQGRVSSHAELDVRGSSHAGVVKSDVLRYVEDGKDKIEEARKKASERDKERNEKKRANKDKQDFKLPFAALQQPKYDFTLAERMTTDPSRVRITFTPKDGAKDEDLYVGEAWVDATKGTLLTMGFRPTKLPFLVSDVNVKLEFNAQTPIGPSVSDAVIDGEGGLLFLRKRFRIRAKIVDYQFF